MTASSPGPAKDPTKTWDGSPPSITGDPMVRGGGGQIRQTGGGVLGACQCRGGGADFGGQKREC
jgi:hypothetical protein